MLSPPVRSSLAVTGHRPDKLGGYSPAAVSRLINFAEFKLTMLAPSSVITGMAQGWDTAIAQACHRLRIPFHAYIPFVGQESRWPPAAQSTYRNLLARADSTRIISPGGFSGRAMQARNEAMVDDSSSLLALYNGSPGGTANCLLYAQALRRPVTNVWSDWLAYPA